MKQKSAFKNVRIKEFVIMVNAFVLVGKYINKFLGLQVQIVA